MQKVVINQVSGNNSIELHSVNLPESWKEVTEKQFKQIFPLLYKTFPTPPVGAVMTKIVKKFVPKKIFRIMNAYHIWDFSNSVRFLWATSSPIAFIRKFRYRLTRYYLPSDYLHNASFIEFIYADSYLAQLANEDSNSENLNKLVATLCRPSKSFWWIRKNLPSNDGDIRQKFNEALMQHRAKRFRKLPIKWKMYVLAYFVACKKEVIDSPNYSLIFPKRKKNNDDQEGGDWMSVLFDVASTPLYGSLDKTSFENLHTVLMGLQNELKKQEKAKEQMQKTKRK